MSRRVLRVIPIFIIVLVVSVLGFMYTIGLFKSDKDSVGVQAVKLLYDFESLDQLNQQMQSLEDICTPEVYTQLSATNQEKALNVYLKFKLSEAVKNSKMEDTYYNPSVRILEEITSSDGGYILYTIDTPALSEGRLFIFSYKLNEHNKLSSVHEMEGIDFYRDSTKAIASDTGE